jgi:hypothetical protein
MLARHVAGGCVYCRLGAHVRTVALLTAGELRVLPLDLQLGFWPRWHPRAQRRHVAAEESDMESGWAELPEELLTKVLKALQAAEHVRPSIRLKGGVGARPRRLVQLACSGPVEVPPRCAGDVAVAETGCMRHRRGGGRAGAAVVRWTSSGTA